ncbi:MAG: DUF2877 domain-containing protein [Candidatus Thorarchaeota archaeon]
MVTHYIQCLEKVLKPFTCKSPYQGLIRSQTFHKNRINLLQKIKDPLGEFQKDFIHLKEKKIAEIERNLSQLLGFGLGSTPESDDIFIGILVAKFCLNEDIDETCKYLSLFPFERFTTPKSTQLIRKILTRNFPPEIIPLIELLKNQEEDNQLIDQFELEVRKIRALGASSGYYFLLGVLWELKNYQKGAVPTPRRITLC